MTSPSHGHRERGLGLGGESKKERVGQVGFRTHHSMAEAACGGPTTRRAHRLMESGIPVGFYTKLQSIQCDKDLQGPTYARHLSRHWGYRPKPCPGESHILVRLKQ